MWWWVGKSMGRTLWRAGCGLDGLFEGFADEIPLDFGSFGDEVGRDTGAESLEVSLGVVIEEVHRAGGVEELVQGGEDDPDVDCFAYERFGHEWFGGLLLLRMKISGKCGCLFIWFIGGDSLDSYEWLSGRIGSYYF